MRDLSPIPYYPRQMGCLQATPDRVAYHTCFEAIVERHDDQENGKKDSGSEQADCRTIQALNDEHRGQSQQDNAHAASRIQAIHGVQT